MYDMLREIVRAFFFIFAAEMGDKTQILSMAFATKFKVNKVLIGVAIGSALNHGIAIALGSYLSNLIPMNIIQIVAGIMFILFGLWSLKSENEDEEEKDDQKFGPILTVALAFFIGELGDKTQLTAMTLSTDSNYPLLILVGTVLGMLVTSGIGIFVGTKIGDKIPETTIKLVSSGVFLFFGTLKLYQTLPKEYLTSMNIGIFLLLLSLTVYILVKPIIKTRKSKEKTYLKEVAATLYTQAQQLKKAMDNLCLGEDRCGKCEGNSCIVGFTRHVLQDVVEDEHALINWSKLPKENKKEFDIDKVIEALSITISYLLNQENKDENNIVNRTKEVLEIIAFGQTIKFKDEKSYFEKLKSIDTFLGKRVNSRVEEIKRGL